MHRRMISLFLLAILPILVVGCQSAPFTSPLDTTSPLAPSPMPRGSFNLTVLHSNDTWGYLDPCG